MKSQVAHAPHAGSAARAASATCLAVGLAVAPLPAQQSAESDLRAAVERYNQAFLGKDLVALKALLAPDVILYEHSVKNIGLDDVWENHLRPEVEAFENTKGEFTDVRVWVSGDVALVTRQYSIQAVMRGRNIDARGNESMGWARRDGQWKVIHIHYSHPCPRPAPPGGA
jgi:ketosteroid isomerase-like protein